MKSNPPKKILIVDDEEEVLIYLTNILKNANYEVIATDKGKDAIGLAINRRPDLIILDIVMPDIGGSEVAALLVGNATTANIPILFLTGILTKQEESFVKKPNKSHVMAKPVTAGELLDMVEKIIPS